MLGRPAVEDEGLAHTTVLFVAFVTLEVSSGFRALTSGSVFPSCLSGVPDTGPVNS